MSSAVVLCLQIVFSDYVLCMYIMCLELVCFVPNECVQCSCFVHLHIVFSVSFLEIEALCEIQFRNLQRTFAPVRSVLHVGLATQSMFFLLPDFSRGVQITLSTILF